MHDLDHEQVDRLALPADGQHRVEHDAGERVGERLRELGAQRRPRDEAEGVAAVRGGGRVVGAAGERALEVVEEGEGVLLGDLEALFCFFGAGGGV